MTTAQWLHIEAKPPCRHAEPADKVATLVAGPGVGRIGVGFLNLPPVPLVVKRASDPASCRRVRSFGLRESGPVTSPLKGSRVYGRGRPPSHAVSPAAKAVNRKSTFLGWCA